VDYLGSASLIAVPLPTLYHSIVLSAGRSEKNGQTFSSESVFLNNSATLYQGFDVSLSGGLSFASDSTGRTSDSRLINGGLSLVPNKSLTISVNHSETQANSQSNASVSAINRTASTTGSIAWVPFSTGYLSYQITRTSGTQVISQTIQSLSASWAPFSSGALNFTASYSEIVQSAFDSIDKQSAFSASYRVGPRILLSAGYTITKSIVPSQTAEAKSLTTDLTMSF
jgi:hypothetical protein